MTYGQALLLISIKRIFVGLSLVFLCGISISMAKHSDLFQLLRTKTAPEGAAVLAHQLFPQTRWYTEGVLHLGSKAPQVVAQTEAIVPESEKSRTLESFKEFAHKKIEEAPAAKISFSGGEVALKEGTVLGRKITISSDVAKPIWSNTSLKIIFYGEASKLNSNSEQADQRAGELLEKMVAAMQLGRECVASFLSAKEDDTFDEFMSGVFHSKPDFVVALGAVATNILLGRKEKLTRVHGQFFPLKLNLQDEQHEVRLMPLFHPDFLLINPNMKRTAWLDLQKIMSELNDANA